LDKLAFGWQKYDWAIVLLVLVVLHCITWGATIATTGLFTDEWELFGILHFIPHNLTDLISRVLHHERFTVRPFLAMLLATLYYFLGDNPYWYHALNQVVEIVGAFFLYLAVGRLSGLKPTAFIAAVIFLLLPNHDMSHYHVTAMSAQIALSLFCAAFYLFVRGAQDGKKWPLWLACVCYFIGLPIYELGIPLFSLLGLSALWILLVQQKKTVQETALRTVLLCLPYVAIVLFFVIFRTVVLPAIGSSTMYKSGFELAHFFAVYKEGITLSLLPPLFVHFAGKASEILQTGLSRTMIFQLIGACLVTAGALFALDGRRHGLANKSSETDQSGETADSGEIADSGEKKILLFLLVFGLIGVLAGYAPYALAPDYMPILDTGYNRINQAASLGASVFFAALFSLTVAFISNKLQMQKALLALIMLPLVALFILADWQYSKAWLASSSVQKRIMAQVRQFAPEIKKADCLILTGAPRYVLWAPLFDSVWDFRSMLRIVLNDDTINGGVTSDRMRIIGDKVKDMYGEAVCGEYEFKNMLVLSPDQEKVFKVNSAAEFIDVIEKYGVKFDLGKDSIERWRKETLDTAKTKSEPQA
jgi:hypothetical protein